MGLEQEKIEWDELICNVEGGSEAPGQVEDNKPGLQSRGPIGDMREGECPGLADCPYWG